MTATVTARRPTHVDDLKGRKSRANLTPVELKIRDAILAVEALRAGERLEGTTLLLTAAQNYLADWIEEQAMHQIGEYIRGAQ